MTDFYIAKEDIPFGDRGAYAHRKGDRVPADNVKANGWEDLVASPASKAGQLAAADAAGETSPATAGKGVK